MTPRTKSVVVEFDLFAGGRLVPQRRIVSAGDPSKRAVVGVEDAVEHRQEPLVAGVANEVDVDVLEHPAEVVELAFGMASQDGAGAGHQQGGLDPVARDIADGEAHPLRMLDVGNVVVVVAAGLVTVVDRAEDVEPGQVGLFERQEVLLDLAGDLQGVLERLALGQLRADAVERVGELLEFVAGMDVDVGVVVALGELPGGVGEAEDRLGQPARTADCEEDRRRQDDQCRDACAVEHLLGPPADVVFGLPGRGDDFIVRQDDDGQQGARSRRRVGPQAVAPLVGHTQHTGLAG